MFIKCGFGNVLDEEETAILQEFLVITPLSVMPGKVRSVWLVVAFGTGARRSRGTET